MFLYSGSKIFGGATMVGPQPKIIAGPRPPEHPMDRRPWKHLIRRIDRQNQSNGSWDVTIFHFFQDGGRLPSWICGAHFGTTREEYLEVCIIVQNLAGIATVVLITCNFEYVTRLAWKRLFTLIPRLSQNGLYTKMIHCVIRLKTNFMHGSNHNEANTGIYKVASTMVATMFYTMPLREYKKLLWCHVTKK